MNKKSPDQLTAQPQRLEDGFGPVPTQNLEGLSAATPVLNTAEDVLLTLAPEIAPEIAPERELEPAPDTVTSPESTTAQTTAALLAALAGPKGGANPRLTQASTVPQPAASDAERPGAELATGRRTLSRQLMEDQPSDMDNVVDRTPTGGMIGVNIFYDKVLKVLEFATDLGVDSPIRQKIRDLKQTVESSEHLCRQLMAERMINRIQLARAFARANQRLEIMSFLDLPPDAVNLRHGLPPAIRDLLRQKRVIPIRLEERGPNQKVLHLAHEDAARDLVLESRLREALPNHSFVWHFVMREVSGSYWLAGEGDDVDAGMEAEALLDRIIANAIDARSSDIHIDPSIRGEPRAIVKYRVDGSVLPKEVITTEQLDRLRVRIENIARMPKVNHYHPNKGSFSRAGFDWRVQIQPHSSPFGPVPRIVLRRLKPDVMPMEVLGYPAYFIEKIKAAAQAPNGVIFWTGPTGSGKTESIHSALVSVNPMAQGLSVHTIEDPPEKRVPGYALQMEAVEEDAARSALSLLKSSLRADPDVIVIGEVRDKEMAKLVFEAANTGHLVFSTLHTNTALDALTRLDELGVNGFLLSYVRGIAAQRLVRRLCVHCRQPLREPDEYTRYVFDRYGIDLDGAAKLFVANPEGCASCNFSGYHGRIAVAEWLKPTKEIVDASAAGHFAELEDMARRAGWQPMGHMGVYHVKMGITDAAELSRKILELSGDIL